MPKPSWVQEKIDAIRDAVASNVEEKRPGVQSVRAKVGDIVLIHDGVRVIQQKPLNPFDEMSVPSTLTAFVGNQGQVTAEISRLNLTTKAIGEVSNGRVPEYRLS
jgi:hypothetical protein